MTGAVATIPSTAKLSASRATPAWLVSVLVGALVFGVGALIVDGLPVGVAHDDGMYVILGKAIATGQGYRWLHVPGAPPATHFPPGYPAVLALLWWFFPAFPANVIVFKLANALFMGVAAAGCFWFVRSRFEMSDVGAAAFSIVATLGIPTLTLSALVMSEPLFLALLLPTLLLAERVANDDSSRMRDVVALASLVGIATLVRTHGIALIGAVALILAFRRRFRDVAVFTGIVVVLLLPWQIWVATHAGVVPPTMRGNYESYGAWFSSGLKAEGFGLIARTVPQTSGDIATMFEVFAAPGMPMPVRYVAVFALAALAAIGARLLWRRARVAAVFLLLYSAIVIVWPFNPQRFLWCVWPLVIVLPILGVREVLRWRPSKSYANAARIAALAASFLIACGYGVYNVRGYRHQYWSSIPRMISRNVHPLLVWVATRTPRDAVLATEAEATVYLYTGRYTVPVGTFTVDEYFGPRTPAENAAVIRSVVTRYHPKAVVVSSDAMRNAARELVLGNPPAFAVVDTFPDGGLVLIPKSR
jgi:hypothetical protein